MALSLALLYICVSWTFLVDPLFLSGCVEKTSCFHLRVISCSSTYSGSPRMRNGSSLNGSRLIGDGFDEGAWHSAWIWGLGLPVKNIYQACASLEKWRQTFIILVLKLVKNTTFQMGLRVTDVRSQRFKWGSGLPTFVRSVSFYLYKHHPNIKYPF